MACNKNYNFILDLSSIPKKENKGFIFSHTKLHND